MEKKYEPKINEYEISLYMSKEDYKLFAGVDDQTTIYNHLFANIKIGDNLKENIKSNSYTCFVKCSATFRLTLDEDTNISFIVTDKKKLVTKTYNIYFKKENYIDEFNRLTKESKEFEH